MVLVGLINERAYKRGKKTFRNRPRQCRWKYVFTLKSHNSTVTVNSTVIQRRFPYTGGGGGLITGCIFLFPARWAYNQGDLKATIFLLHSKLPASFPVSLRKRLFKTMRNSLMTTSKALCMKQKWMNLGIWLCTNWPRDTPSLLMRTICVIWQQSPS